MEQQSIQLRKTVCMCGLLLILVCGGVLAGICFTKWHKSTNAILSDFYYRPVEKAENFPMDQIDMQFQVYRDSVDNWRENKGPMIAEVLGIHHPVFDDHWQQMFTYRLSEEECQRSERLLKDLIRHSNKILLIRGGTDQNEHAVLLPTKQTQESLADAFVLNNSQLFIPSQTVFTDGWRRVIVLYPSGVQFCYFDQKKCYISTHGWLQRLEGAENSISQEFIDLCWTLGD